MSEELLSRLQKETGCDTVFGAMLLKFTGGDVDGAIQIMNSVDKNIYILKGKFIGQSSKSYGAFIIVFNIKLKMYHISEIVLVKDDKSGIEFDFSRSWRDYLNDLRLYKKRNIVDTDNSPAQFSLGHPPMDECLKRGVLYGTERPALPAHGRP